MLKKLIGYLLIAAIIFGGWYFLSPVFALKGLRDAAAARDAEAVMDYVDLPALRASLKDQIKERLEDEAAGKSGIEALGMQIGLKIAGPAIDVMLTEENVARMIEEQALTDVAVAATGAASAETGLPAQDSGSTSGATGDVSTETELLPADAMEPHQLDFDIERIGLDEFRVHPKDDETGGELIFTRHGIGWKLSGMELPEGPIFGR